jgi:transcriptional antiterminator NusG
MNLQNQNEEMNIPYIVGETVKVTLTVRFNSFSGVIEEVNEEKKKLEGNGENFRT